MTQRIKYQDTTVAPVDSVGHITKAVMRHRATRFEQLFDPQTARITGIRFAIEAGELGEIPVRLIARTENVAEILWKRRGPRSRKSRDQIHEQAERIAWRQLKDVVEQLLFAVETGLMTLPEAFMSSVEVWDDAESEVVTMAELMSRRAVSIMRPEGSVLALGPGGDF